VKLLGVIGVAATNDKQAGSLTLYELRAYKPYLGVKLCSFLKLGEAASVRAYIRTHKHHVIARTINIPLEPIPIGMVDNPALLV
jgi:hypothetical protein